MTAEQGPRPGSSPRTSPGIRPRNRRGPGVLEAVGLLLLLWLVSAVLVMALALMTGAR